MTTDEPGGLNRKESPGLRLALDFGPLLVFFAVNALAPGSDIDQAVWATGAFMGATVIAMLVSYWKTRTVTMMQWVTLVIVGVFGGLTIYLHDETFIQMKPTVVYLIFAAVLLTGLFTGRPLLKMVLESGFPPMTDRGWHLLTRNWALFFLALAVLNEVLRQVLTFDQWVQFKVWGLTILGFVFAASQFPIMTRHAKDSPADREGK
ncbi:septation protein A [Pacificimonas flava]|uniref:Inner membrane-spanning protein YciB n=1 Tax=Pacificimonas flava TaxID=1234595 RepID=M2T8X5_9SPHN|nr:septation protein A [Pacificimonas flava]EMD82959.1 putative intracellular septation protein [Pacificimonas flava]MBB5280119.1 intracellular septation protein [Pacificimonas flava]